MEEIITFKLKKGKDEKKILFIIMNKEYFSCSNEMKGKIINKYIEIVSKQDSIYICVDTRKITSFNPKIMWEGSSDLVKYRSILEPRVKATSILICNKLLLDTVGMITKIIPFISPTKFFSKNDDALKFLNES